MLLNVIASETLNVDAPMGLVHSTLHCAPVCIPVWPMSMLTWSCVCAQLGVDGVNFVCYSMYACSLAVDVPFVFQVLCMRYQNLDRVA
jgi:hypothetical protein